MSLTDIHILPNSWFNTAIPASINLFEFNKRNSRTMCEICSKLTTKTSEQCH